jgi:serine/threonine protein kinase
MSLENQYQQTLKTKQCPSCKLFVDPSLTVCPNDGTSLIERFDKDPAFVNYEFLGTIGSGGMGVIYKARQVILNKVVAIKTLHPHLSSPAAFRRFQIEGQATSLLNHPFIVSVHDFGVTKSGQTFMVMDFVDGETLDSLLRRVGQLDQRRFLNIFIDVCDAMAHAHHRLVVHRDIKSSNIMIMKGDNGREEVRIMDFGIAKLVSDSESVASQVTRTGEIIGSATCMSPEQARGGKVDHRSDLYALGCVMYEALASAPPFVGNTPLETMLMHLERRPASIKEASMGNSVDPRLEKIIFCLLEKEPDHRYQSMDDLKHDLENLRGVLFGAEKVADFKMPNREGDSRAKSSRARVTVILSAMLIGVSALSAGLYVFSKHKLVSSGATNSVQPVVENKASVGAGETTDKKTKRVSDSNIVAMLKMPGDEELIKQAIDSQLERGELKVHVEGLTSDIIDADLTSFKKGDFPNTKIVDLSHSRKVTDAGLQNLENLSLTEIDLKDSGASDLDWLTHQNELKRLYISGSPITPKGFQNIGKLTELRELDIDRTKFKDSDVASISKLVNLEKLDVSSTQISLFGYDRLLNTYHKCFALFWAPTVQGGKDCLTGVWAPVDNRPLAEIHKDAEKAMMKAQWRDADVQLERVILRVQRNEKHGKATQADILMLVTCEGERGNCLKNMGLPYAAIYMYNLTAMHLQTLKLAGVYIADMLQRVASVYESMSGNSELEKAIEARRNAEAFFAMAASDPNSAATRQNNLNMLRADRVRFARQSH